MKAVSVSRISKTYGSRFGSAATPALIDLSFEVDQGDFVAIMGPSGSGKTTLLQLLALVDRPDSGTLRVGETDLAALEGDDLARFRRRTVGLVFQDSALLDTLTLGENLAFPLALDRVPPGEIRDRVGALARELGIEGLLDRYPAEVSGGQRQRAAAGRALVARPGLLLADEPTGALDSRSGRDLLACLEGAHRTRGTTVLLVTHDPQAASWARRVLFLRDGRLFSEVRAGADPQDFLGRILEVQGALGARLP